MTSRSDISMAFAHPLERAEASAPEGSRDRISLRDYLVEADIGAFQKERGHKQRLRFNVVVEVAPAPEPLHDDVDRILSYDRITEVIGAGLAAQRLNLLETLADYIADHILAEPQALRVFVRIEKLDVGPYALGVEIERSRKAEKPREEETIVHPLVAYFDNATIAAPDLSAKIDALEARGLPIIFCVGLPEGPILQSGSATTQRRIDLLAIEQNAWVLAARDRRCVVVSSRTEIDWAIKRGRSVVWAPSKLVLDAVDGPKSQDALALSLWLAEQMQAALVVLHGNVSAPAGSRMAIERA